MRWISSPGSPGWWPGLSWHGSSCGGVRPPSCPGSGRRWTNGSVTGKTRLSAPGPPPPGFLSGRQRGSLAASRAGRTSCPLLVPLPSTALKPTMSLAKADLRLRSGGPGVRAPPPLRPRYHSWWRRGPQRRRPRLRTRVNPPASRANSRTGRPPNMDVFMTFGQHAGEAPASRGCGAPCSGRRAGRPVRHEQAQGTGQHLALIALDQPAGRTHSTCATRSFAGRSPPRPEPVTHPLIGTRERYCC